MSCVLCSACFSFCPKMKWTLFEQRFRGDFFYHQCACKSRKTIFYILLLAFVCIINWNLFHFCFMHEVMYCHRVYTHHQLQKCYFTAIFFIISSRAAAAKVLSNCCQLEYLGMKYLRVTIQYVYQLNIVWACRRLFVIICQKKILYKLRKALYSTAYRRMYWR